MESAGGRAEREAVKGGVFKRVGHRDWPAMSAASEQELMLPRRYCRLEKQVLQEAPVRRHRLIQAARGRREGGAGAARGANSR